MTRVPYKGTSPALQSLMGGEVGAAIVSMAEAMPQVKAGKVIAVATSGPAAKEMFPDQPEFKESHPDLEISVWFGLFAAASTPPDVVAHPNAEVNKVLAHADVKNRLAEFGLTARQSTPAELDRLMVADRARLGPPGEGAGHHCGLKSIKPDRASGTHDAWHPEHAEKVIEFAAQASGYDPAPWHKPFVRRPQR